MERHVFASTASLALTAISASYVPVGWNDITGKPAIFTPAPHNHTYNDITDLDDYSSSVIISASNVTGLLELLSTSTSSGNYDTTLDDSLEMISAVGGYDAGTTVADLKGDALVTMWDNLLFPTVAPTLVNPSSTFTDNVASIFEISSSQNITFTSTFDSGSISVGSTVQGGRSGDPNAYTYTGTGLPTTVSSSVTPDSNVVNNYYILIGNQSWTNYVSYDSGPQPLDSKGNPSGTPLPAGNTSTDTITIEGVYPLYGTTSDITTMTKQSLVSMLTANNVVFNLVAETGGNKQKFDIPDAWTGIPTSRPLVGIETYNTISSTWEYQGGSAGTSLGFWTTSATTQTVQGNVVNYTRYTYNGTDRSDVQIRLKF